MLTLLRRTLINISKCKRTKHEIAVLATGLNYVVAPKRIPHDEFILASKLAVIELTKQYPNKDHWETDVLRVVDALSRLHPPKQNLSKDERKQISSLAKRKDLLVLLVNTGKATVLMDTQEYKDKIKAMLV